MTAIDERTPMRDFPLQNERHLDRDPFVVFDQFRESPPFWCPDLGGFWVVTRYPEVREVLQDASRFSSVNGSVPPMPPSMATSILPSVVDPPYVQRLRSIVLPYLTAQKVDALEPHMRSVSSELIAAVQSRGHCEVVTEIARQYPIRVFMDLYGMPFERKEELRLHAETYLHDFEHREVGWSSIQRVMREEIRSRLESPREDMLSGIAHAEVDGQAIDMDVAVNLAANVLVGGLDTLPSVIGWTLRHLAEHPELRRRIIDEPSVVPTAVEEFFRIYSVVSKESRRVARDIEFAGVKMRAGEHVMAMTSLANRDSREFDDPLNVNFDRKINRQLAFAAGPHRCLGSHLARHELEVLLHEWHAKIPDYRVPADATITYIGGGVLAMEQLPLEWDI
jgi:cytochrome P450